MHPQEEERDESRAIIVDPFYFNGVGWGAIHEGFTLHLGVVLSNTVHHGINVPTHELLRDILIQSTNQKGRSPSCCMPEVVLEG